MPQGFTEALLTFLNSDLKDLKFPFDSILI